MENTIESAKDFWNKCQNDGEFINSGNAQFEHEKCMVAYVSACSAPSSIGEEMKVTVSDEDIVAKANADGLNWLSKDPFVDGAKWMRSRLSERKIVLPSELDITEHLEYLNQNGFLNTGQSVNNAKVTWNECVELIKRLNGIN